MPSRHSIRNSYDGRTHRHRRRSHVERLEERALFSAGSLDPSYGTGGEVTTDFPHADHSSGYEIIRQAAIQPDGRVVVAGPTSLDSAGNDYPNDFALARYDAGGSLDATFGAGGRVVTHFNNEDSHPVGLAIQPDRKILVVGNCFDLRTGNVEIGLARYNADGSLDLGFGSAGQEVILPGTSLGAAAGIAVQSDGSFVVAGDAAASLALARFNPNGSVDTNFGTGGLADSGFPSLVGPIGGGTTGVAIQGDGKLICYGSDGTDFALVRYQKDGTVDTGFGSGGLALTHFPAYASAGISGVVIQPDGKILAAGTTATNYPGGSPGDFALARYNTDGSLDPNFGSQGLVTTDLGQDEWINSVALQSDGRIVVGGGTSDDFTTAQPTTSFALARYQPNGSLDGSYGANGVVTAAFASGTYANISSIVLQADNQVVAAGVVISNLGTGWDFALARFGGGDLNVVGQQQVSTQCQQLEGAVSQPGQSDQIGFQVADNNALSDVIDAANRYDVTNDPYGLPSAPVGSMRIVIDMSSGTYGGQTINLWPGETLVINGSAGTTTFVGHSPALTVAAGTVIANGITFTNATDAPTILVTGGAVTLRDSTIEESTGYAQVAIQTTGGTVDLGSTADPGGNTINVNGAGALIQDTGPNPVLAVGTSFTINEAPLAPSSLSGLVFSDFNDDGQVDFGEQGIVGVPIALDGTDFLGNPVHSTAGTDGDGAYLFPNLQPGHYMISETQPAGYTQGINSVGTGGGTVALDQFDVHLAAGLNALNYNFGERPAATGAIHCGQTAGIGFWNNRRGQALIEALNGGAGTQLGDWLAATFPHMFGHDAGASDLAARSNADIASFFQSRFVVHGQKLDAQVLATALAVYVTDPTLDSTGVGARYGFTVGGNGLATATYNVGSNGAAFGVANNTVMTVLDILLAADAEAVNGVLYSGDRTRRQANTVFSDINEVGNIR